VTFKLLEQKAIEFFFAWLLAFAFFLQEALPSSTLQEVQSALQKIDQIHTFAKEQRPKDKAFARKVVETAIKTLWKLQRNQGRCQHIDPKGVCCNRTVWDYLLNPRLTDRCVRVCVCARVCVRVSGVCVCV
jgi:hypothetical protein